MVRVNADTVTLKVEGVLTKLGMTKLVLMEVGPTPYTGIDDMGKSLTPGNLRRKMVERSKY